MTLITIDRFTAWVRNAFRIVGPYAPDLPASLQPVYDMSGLDALNDDSIAYWYTTSKSVAALVANFSTVALRVSGGGRFIVDGLSLLAQAAQQTIVVGIAPGASAGAVAAFQLNPFSVRAGFAAPQTLGTVFINVEQTVGGRLGGVGFSVTTPAGQGLNLSWLSGTLPPFVLTPGAGGGNDFNLIVETNIVNLPLAVGGFWGRWFPEAPQA
jgi:hypothetical protein